MSKFSEDQYLQEGDLIIADASEDYDDIGKAIEVKDINNEKVLAGLHTILARDEKNITVNGFKAYLFSTNNLKTKIKIIANGISVLGISKNNLSKLIVEIPSKNEQQNIVSFISDIDKKIELLEKKHQLYIEFKKYLMQKIFTQKLRLIFLLFLKRPTLKNIQFTKFKLNKISKFYKIIKKYRYYYLIYFNIINKLIKKIKQYYENLFYKLLFIFHNLKFIMKTKIINKIKSKMKLYLDENQLIILDGTLKNIFIDYDIVECKSDFTLKESKENSALLMNFLASKHVEGCSERTILYYHTTIEKMLNLINKKIEYITTDDLRKYLSEYRKINGASKATVDNIRRVLSSFFSWLEDEDYILKNPVRRIHKIKTKKVVKEVLSDENFEILRDKCNNIRDLAMIELLASTGIRVGELVNLNIEDVLFNERECVVLGKGDSERIVYFDAKTKIHLQKYLESRKDNNPALFVSFKKPYKRLGINGVERRIRELGQQSNIKKVHPHKFRRTMATNAIDKGMPIEQVQKLLGHVQIDTTMQYAMVNQNNVKISHRKFIG